MAVERRLIAILDKQFVSMSIRTSLALFESTEIIRLLEPDSVDCDAFQGAKEPFFAVMWPVRQGDCS